METNRNNIEVPAQLMGINSKVDGTLSLRFTTQELTSEDKVTILDHQNMPGFLLFSPNQFSDADVPKEEAPDNSLTPSKRLRNVLYRYWECQLDCVDLDCVDSEVHYRREMEKIIEHYKKKLPERG